MAKAEYGRVVYFNAANSGPVQDGREEAGGMGGYALVGTGGNWPVRVKVDNVSNSGGGRREGGGGIK